MFPADAITQSHELVGASSFTYDAGSNVKYILQMTIQSSGQASDTILYCGSTIIARNYAKDMPNVLMHYRCENTINATETGGNDRSIRSVVTVTYVSRDLLLQSPYNSLTVSDFATGSAVMNGLADTFNIFFVFLLFCVFYMFFNIGKGLLKK